MNMHQEPMWTEASHGSKKLFELKKTHINKNLAAGSLNVKVFDSKVGPDPLIGSCTVNVTKFTNSLSRSCAVGKSPR